MNTGCAGERAVQIFEYLRLINLAFDHLFGGDELI